MGGLRCGSGQAAQQLMTAVGAGRMCSMLCRVEYIGLVVHGLAGIVLVRRCEEVLACFGLLGVLPVRHRFLAAYAVLIGLWMAQAEANAQKPAEPPHTTKPFDPAAIRRQAAQMAEIRTALSDADPTVRLLTMREVIANGDPIQRDYAIEAGLASSESVMMNMALRGILANTHQIVIEFLDKDNKVTVEGGVSSLRLTMEHFDIDSGQLNGMTACNGARGWSGQLQGIVFAFNDKDSICSGTLSWASETSDFRGRINLYGGQASSNRSAVWKPR